MTELFENIYLFLSNHMTLVVLFIFIILEQIFKRFPTFEIFSKEQGQNFVWITVFEFIFESFLTIGKFFLITKVNTFFQYFGIYQINITWLNPFVQGTIYLLLFTLILYWLHFLMHKVPFLWNFHKLHHSSEELIASSTIRGHFLETILLDGLSIGIVNLFMYETSVIENVNFFILIWTFYIHSNTRFKIKAASFVLITPHDHLWHHAKDCKLNSGQNFGAFLSIWDKIFNTYYYDEKTPESGIHESYTKNYFLKLVNPFLNK